MSLILYSNGIIEGYRPQENVFTDEELYGVFDGVEYLVSTRLPDVANTWCLWGVAKDPPENEFNKIGAEIVEEDIWTHLMLIHDSEINPDWNITDEILYKSYEEYTLELGEFINGIVFEIQQMVLSEQDGASQKMIKLSAVGHTPDKRVIFKYNPLEQSEEFHKTEFSTFGYKIKDYLNDNFDENISNEISHNQLIIFADTKTIIVVDKEHTDGLFSSIIDLFVSIEDFETASYIKSTQDEWLSYTNGDIGYDENGKIHKIDGKIASEKKTKPRKNKK